MSDDPIGLEAVAAELYGGSPDAFVTARTAAAKQARTSGDKVLATAIGKLRRPTRTAWLVNLLARDAVDDLAGLLELGEALRVAQERLSGDDLRRLSVDRRRMVDVLAARAVELGRAGGYDAPDSVRQEVGQTLQAGLADPDLAARIRRGTVAAAGTSGGFGPFSLGDPAAPPATAAPATKQVAVPGVEPAGLSPAERRAAKALLQARTVAAERSAAADRAQEDAGTAADAATAATTEADAAADRADELRSQLKDAEDTEKRARRVARQARKAAEDAGRTRDAARRAADEAAAHVADLERA